MVYHRQQTWRAQMYLAFCTKIQENYSYYLVCPRPSLSLQDPASPTVGVSTKNSCPSYSASHSGEQGHYPHLNFILLNVLPFTFPAATGIMLFLPYRITWQFQKIYFLDQQLISNTDQQQNESKTLLRVLSHFWKTGLSNPDYLIQNTQDFYCKETWAACESWKHGTGNATQISWSDFDTSGFEPRVSYFSPEHPKYKKNSICNRSID